MLSSLDRRWITRWIAGSTLAHLLGGGSAVAIILGGYQVGLVGSSVAPALAVGAVAGLVAGIVVGAVSSVLLPHGVSRRGWIRSTTVGAMFVWTLIAITPALLVTDADTPTKPLLARIALAMCAGASAGMLLSAFQAPVMAALTVRLRPWLLSNGAAWGTATPITYAVTGVPRSASSTALSALILLTVAGVSAGTATAITLLLEERRAQLIGQSTGRTCATELV